MFSIDAISPFLIGSGWFSQCENIWFTLVSGSLIKKNVSLLICLSGSNVRGLK